MPVLKNSRHELMAQSLAAGNPVVKAYVDAGYKANRSNSHRLKENEGIKARVAELRNKAAARTEITVQKLLEDLERIKANAEKLGQNSAAAQAVMGQAKLAGLIVERSEISQVNEFAGMSPQRVRQELVMRARRLGLDRELAGLLAGSKAVDQEGEQDEDDRLN
jgi:methylphosphotriester-DNA--protein-cysteine methyltransferase